MSEATRKLPFGITAVETSPGVWEWECHVIWWRWEDNSEVGVNFGYVDGHNKWWPMWYVSTMEEAACFSEGFAIGRRDMWPERSENKQENEK